MFTHTQSIIIHAPINDVYCYLTNHEQAKIWSKTNIDTTWQKSSPIIYTCYTKTGEIMIYEGRKMQWNGVIKDIIPNEFYSIEYQDFATTGLKGESYRLNKITEYTTELINTSTYTTQSIMEDYADGIEMLLDSLSDYNDNLRQITIETIINLNIDKVWNFYTDPVAVMEWNAASDDWHTTKAVNDLVVGQSFEYTMAAKDGSISFDLKGTYTKIEKNKIIDYALEDGREVTVEFYEVGNQTHIFLQFYMESQNSRELQQSGWQSILNNFKKYCEMKL
jgi:uncharacterized protein YndB with AHSA1/START domain